MGEGKYVFTQVDQQGEFQRLSLQERTVDWLSKGALVEAGVGEGSACLEVGVGVGSMTRWMSAQVGPNGYVLGVDINDAFYPAAMADNVELRKDDIRTTPLVPGSFDAVHCRLLLMHLPPDDRRLVLGRVLESLRPGGWLVALDPSLGVELGAGGPADQLWRRFRAGIMASTAADADFDFGQTLGGTLLGAGFVDVDAYGAFGYVTEGGSYQRYVLQSLETAGPPFVVGAGHMSQSELDELRDHVLHGRLNVGYTAGVAWGRRPG